MKRSEQQFGLKSYIKKEPLKSYCYLSPSGSVYFHWSDWKDTCFLQHSFCNKNLQGRKRLKELEDTLSNLKQVAAWIIHNHQTEQISLFDLYQTYLDPRIRECWFRKGSDVKVSLSGPTGPFMDLESMRWFNKQIYTDFIYQKILRKNLTLRGFRLRLHAPVLCHIGETGETRPLYVEQLTKGGVLFYIQGNETLTRFMESEQLFIEMNPSLLYELSHQDADKLQMSLSCLSSEIFKGDGNQKVKYQVDMTQVKANMNDKDLMRYHSFREYFVFIPYDAFIPAGHEMNMKTCLKGCLEHVEELFNEELLEVAA
jgi:hypothetical protein